MTLTVAFNFQLCAAGIVDVPSGRFVRLTHNLRMCEEKLRLTQEYQTANRAFGDAVKALMKKAGTTSKEEYKRLRQRSKELQLDSESARLRLDRHIGQHGC